MSKVKCFTEKPNLEWAQTFVQGGEFFWNSGIFIWKVEQIIKAIKQFLPEHYSLFNSIIEDYGTPTERKSIERVFSECRAISIDYGVMGKAEKGYVRCGDWGWSDVRTGGSVYRRSRKDKYAKARPDDA